MKIIELFTHSFESFVIGAAITFLIIIPLILFIFAKSLKFILTKMNYYNNHNEFTRRLYVAIGNDDYETIEGLRDEITDEDIDKIFELWKPSLPWHEKNAIAYVVMDQEISRIRPIMEEAINSPDIDTKAYAYLLLTNNHEEFDSFMQNGILDEAEVDLAIKKYRLTQM